MNVSVGPSAFASSPTTGLGRRPRPNIRAQNNRRRRSRSSAAAAATAASLSVSAVAAGGTGAAAPRRMSVVSVAEMAEVVEEVVAIRSRRRDKLVIRQEKGNGGGGLDVEDQTVSFIGV